ncbi:hypothetical protein [Bradyrhizobium sp. SZCCHNR2012]|uniref:hypothetical protein n=1 Tax=Bradyrhizobium sp. SZCCHNR2012 TaxID=3057377 RepID=UPI0028E8CFB1|nr:hypothetical protein [Bradyrhizobium sp. SZCCHNR2012]
MSAITKLDFSDRTVEEAARELVRAERINGAVYINLPMLYPDGSFVTVRVDKGAYGFRVSDAGFAYREVEDIAGARSFRRIANRVAEANDVVVGERILYVGTGIENLERAICDVAATAWTIVHSVAEKAFDEDELGLSDELSTRLKRVFGDERVEDGVELVGASTTSWPVTALVKTDGAQVVFQAVSENANSINRASTAFRDLSTLGHRAPKLVAYVRSKKALGSKLALLTPARIVEEAQPNEFLERAAA